MEGSRLRLKPRLNKDEVKELLGGAGNYQFDWFVTAVRKGFENHEPIQVNQHFKPELFVSIENIEEFYRQDTREVVAVRNLLISNGILNADGTLNRAKCLELGFRLPMEKTERTSKSPSEERSETGDR